MSADIFILAVAIVVAAFLGVVLRFFKQPAIVAYLLTGAILSYLGLWRLTDGEVFKLFSDLGIMFLLFLVGLEMNYASWRLTGRSTTLVGLAQISVTFLAGLVLAKVFGFDWTAAAYLAMAFTFSSTIIVVKLIGDRRDLNSLYGRISIGVLLAQDAVAIMLLVFLTSLENKTAPAAVDFLLILLAHAALFVAIVALSRYVFPRLFKHLNNSSELLFLVSLAWMFLLAALVSKIGLSLEIAGFLAGLALANSSEHFQIAYYIRPLRDFFLLIFFVVLGSSFLFAAQSGWLLPALAFSAFVLLAKPLIVMAAMGITGHRRRTGFMCGAALSQVSEFSLILAALGLKLGQIDQGTVAIITLVGIVSILSSGYFMIHADFLYEKLHPWLKIFERRRAGLKDLSECLPYRPIVLIGYHRTGKSIMYHLDKDQVMVVDFDPDVINGARALGLPAVLGDISDPEVAQLAHLKTAKMIICTSPDIEDSLLVLNAIKNLKRRPLIVARASRESEARELYRAGATYALLPLFSAGDYLGKLLSGADWKQSLSKLKERDLKLLAKLHAF